MDSIISLNEKLKSGEVNSRELVQDAISKANKYKSLNAFNLIRHESQIASISKNEITDLISGIPMSVKDVYVTKGITTTASSKALEHYIPQYDATTYSRLVGRGALMIGKNNSDPFAFGASGENSGFGPTQNPLCISKVPGGSSSGSAASVAAGINLYSIGSDTGGSIRQPASLSGVTGLKATYGRNSRYGLIAMASSFDSPGVIANNVENAYIVQKSIEGFDPKDSTTNPNIKQIDYATLNSDFVHKTLQQDIKGTKIGLPKEYFIDGMDDDVSIAVKNAAKKFESMGAIIEEISLPHTKYALPVYYVLVPSEISSNMGRFDGIRYGESSSYDQSLENFYLENRELLEEEVKRRIMIGTFTLTKGYADAYYKTAMRVRSLIIQDFNEAYKKVDVILTPISPTVAWDIGEKVDDPLQMYLADIFTVSANCAGIPGLSIPCGFKMSKDEKGFGVDKDGKVCDKLPIGMQILGPKWSEDLICRVGWNFENI